jgi:hypothetical protein
LLVAGSPGDRRRGASRSPAPRGRSRSRSPPRGGDEGGWREKLERLYSKGELRKSDLDERTLSDLEALREDEASCVIDRLTEADFRRVNNINRFVVGIIRRVQRDGPDRGEANLDSLPKSVARMLEDLIADVSAAVFFFPL